MEILLGLALLGAAVTAFLWAYHAVRGAHPPRWAGENMTTLVIVPGIMFLGIGGGGILLAAFLQGTWRNAGGATVAGSAALLAVYGAAWAAMARRRRAAQAGAAAAAPSPLPAAAAAVVAAASAAAAGASAPAGDAPLNAG